MNEWLGEWMNKKVSECSKGWMNEWIEGQVNEWMNEWMNYPIKNEWQWINLQMGE